MVEAITKQVSTKEFRDTIATVDRKGKRIWINPKKPKGKYHTWRLAVSVFLLGIFFAGPFIEVSGRPLMLLDFFERRFIIFGQPFWPQDFVLLAITLITFFVFVILFTVVFGRVWCGWMCPQTLFMEMVFRKIEYWIEGDAAAQRRLDQHPWDLDKLWRKAAKQSIFILISLLIAHTVMAYIIGVDRVLQLATRSPSDNLAGFLGTVAFAATFYGVFAFFREQACIAVCPYGRLQGVLLGKDSIVVAYDWLRGEPRWHLKKNNAPTGQGDCVDCRLCVHVCPTGIDIRNGTQLECVNCTACIDACDDVMIRIGKPKGLIRYASYNSISQGIQKLFTSRVAGYSAVLFVLVGILGFALAARSDIDTTVLKVPGTLYQRTQDGFITNLYNIEFVNKTFDALPVDLRVESPAEAELHQVDQKGVAIPAEGMLKGVYFIRIPAAKVTRSRTIVTLGIYHEGKIIEKVDVKFIGPVTTALQKGRP